MVFADYLLVITFLPAACIVRERYFPRQCKNCVSAPVGAAPSSDDKVDEVRPPDAKTPRLVERFDAAFPVWPGSSAGLHGPIRAMPWQIDPEQEPEEEL